MPVLTSALVCDAILKIESSDMGMSATLFCQPLAVE